MIRPFAIALALHPVVAQALTLDIPSNATATAQTVRPVDSINIPTGPFADGAIPSISAEGEVTQNAWRVASQGLTSLQLLAPLRDQLIADGFTVLLDCDATECGGFDFRFGIDVLPAPDMFVNLGDFRFLAAKKADDPATHMTVLTSVTSSTGYIQVTRVGGSTGAKGIATSTKSPVRAVLTTAPTDFVAELEGIGRSVLSDLAFETGSSNLGEGNFGSLQALADYLDTNPNRTVALVGHTDSQGSLSGNMSLSKRRASSVLERLVSEYGVPRQQLEAEGMGYLAPIATNLTEEGRDTNRRVEVIMTSTE